MACLQSRFDNGLPFALQYWTFEGKAQRTIVLFTPANARWSVGADQINITTVMVEGSLPALVPFLRGMNDGFIGKGGYLISGGLYVERSTLEL